MKRPWFVLLLLLACAGCGSKNSATPSVPSLPPTNTNVDPTRYVNPLIGTGGWGNTFPGATVPFGMLQWSPETIVSGPFRGLYKYDNTFVRGFALTHLSGAGCAAFGDFPVLPWAAPLRESPAANPEGMVVFFNRLAADGSANEQSEPGYYSLRLSTGVRVELTTDRRSGMARFSFPASGTNSLLINTGGSINADEPGRENDTSSVEITAGNTVKGRVTSGGFCGRPNNYTLYFVASFDSSFESYGVWSGNVLTPDAATASAHKTGAYVTFPKSASTVRMRVGLSYVSLANAQANLDSEIPGFDFDGVRARAAATWKDALGKIELEGGSTDQKTIFYTALYHNLLAPNLFSDVNGDYLGFDGNIHNAGSVPQFANFSDWDTYRGTIQLQTMLFPETANAFATSLLRDAQESGSLPKWALANDATDVMGGDSPTLLIANAYGFGAHNFDVNTALQFMVKGARDSSPGLHGFIERPEVSSYTTLGYVPTEESDSSVSHTLEYSSADFAISRLADAAGNSGVRDQFMASAGNWRKVFDQSIGLTRPRYRDGSFLVGFDADNALPKRISGYDDQLGYEEGTSWQYTWMVPHQMKNLFETMGGNVVAVQKLDSLFSSPRVSNGGKYFNPGNEPGFATPYAYEFAASPWKTQELIPKLLGNFYKNAPDGLPGNDDLGALSAQYVFGSLGLYPAIPATGGFVIGSPAFTKATIHLGDGRVLTIRRSGPGVYIQSAQFNGSQRSRLWLSLSELSTNNSLDFTMGETANTGWGSAPEDAPPSF